MKKEIFKITLISLFVPWFSALFCSTPISEMIGASPKSNVTLKNQTPLIPKSLVPWDNGDPNELVEFNFEDAELSTIVSYIETRFNITFILDTVLNPLPPQGKNITGIKLSFKTNKPLPKKEAWALFIKFLDMAGLAVVPGPTDNVYRITTTDEKSPLSASKERIPTLIGTNPKLLPEDSSWIRYVYFARNTSLDMVKNLFNAMKSQASPRTIDFPELRALMITDKAINIKSIIEIINELDNASEPETLSIVKLQHTDATKIAKFYASLIEENDQQGLASRLATGKRQTLSYFPVGVRVIPEPRSNVLLLLGAAEGIAKVEEFIINTLDKQSNMTHRFTKIIPLKHIQASAAEAILSKVIQFKSDAEAAQYGSIRDGDKYFKPISIIAEDSGNRLILTGDYDDCLKITEVLNNLDVEPPMIALQVFIVNTSKTALKDFGTQIRNKIPGITGLLGNNVNFQTSGVNLNINSKIVENTTEASGAYRLLGNLVQLALGGAVGSTYLTLGSDAWGVWGILRMLERYTNATIVQNPFITVTNNYPATFTHGTTRLVQSGTTYGTTGTTENLKDLKAELELTITPRISYEGYVTLNVAITDCQFTDLTNTTNGNRITKTIKSSLILADGETVVLGGLIRNFDSEDEILGSPLGKIPIIGWLLGKTKEKNNEKSSLLIFITPTIIPPESTEEARKFTKDKFDDITKTLSLSTDQYQLKDPIHRWYFDDIHEGKETLTGFVKTEGAFVYPSQKKQLNKTASGKPLSSYLP